MGAKTWMLVGADGLPRDALRAGGPLDRDAAVRLARAMFPGRRLEEAGDGNLSTTCPPDDEVHVGCFPGLRIVAASEFAIDFPSHLPEALRDALGTRDVYLHAMHSGVDWFALAHWRDGKLQRTVSLSPGSGVLEDVGQRFPFEDAFWGGKHPVDDLDDASGDAYPLAFHPLELGEAALNALFGYFLEGPVEADMLEPREIPLVRMRNASP